MDKIIEGHFNFAYPNNNVFEHTYLDIDYGDIVLVIGRNGIGKSTLLKLLARIEKFSQYSDIKHHISKSHISYMPSNISFYPQMRGLDLVSFYRDLNPDFDLAYAQKYLQAFNIDLKKKIKTFSDGEKKLLALTICLSFKRKLYIIDEPFPNVDILNDEIVRKMIIEKYNETTTFIIATHQINEFEKVANKCLLIKNPQEIEILNTDDIRYELNCSIEEYFKERIRCLKY